MIKKTNTKNEYIRVGNVYVRNYTKPNVIPVDISNNYSHEDYELFLSNEEHNKRFTNISNEKIIFPKLAIISDGFDFENHYKTLLKIPNLAILAVNGALKKWDVYKEKTINAYVLNNPYPEAMEFMPSHPYRPACLASIRANAEFCRKYKGDIYTYRPTPNKVFGYSNRSEYYIDDYRNAICAAIGFAYQFEVEKLMLVCCDNYLKDKKEFAQLMPNGLWAYPQQILSQKIIDANLSWLKIPIASYSYSPDYKNSIYIKDEESAVAFFKD